MESKNIHVHLEHDLANKVIFRADEGGCAFYRAYMPAKAVGAAVSNSFLVRRNPLDATDLAMAGMGVQTTLFQRPTKPDIPTALKALQAAGRRAGVELDDDVFHLSYQNPVYAYWPKEDLRAMSQALKAAQFVTCSTAPLANVIREHGAKNVFVIPNSIDTTKLDMAWADRLPRGTPEKPLLVGWGGSWTHMHDIKLALPALLWAGKQPNVKLLFFGFNPFDMDKNQAGEYTHPQGFTYRFVPWEKDMYSHYFNISQLDIALAPVLDNAFNASKSNLKWLEHSIFKTPVIASRTVAYASVKHGETGFLARNEADFIKYMQALVKHEHLRNEIGAAAQEDVLEKYIIEKVAPLWKQALA